MEKAKKTEMDYTLEEAMELLKKVSEDLESGEHTLEESFDLYQKGIALTAYCNSCIDRVEKKCLVIREGEVPHEL